MTTRTVIILKGEGNVSLTTTDEEHKVHLFAIGLSKITDYSIVVEENDKMVAGYHRGVNITKGSS